MVTSKDIGNLAESLAVQYLAKQGYRILTTQWHHGHLELDIIARDKDELVIVEVKARSGLRYEHPSEAVTQLKMRRIIEATDAYLIEHQIELNTRFDIITVVFFKKGYELEHYKDAFYPTL